MNIEQQENWRDDLQRWPTGQVRGIFGNAQGEACCLTVLGYSKLGVELVATNRPGKDFIREGLIEPIYSNDGTIAWGAVYASMNDRECMSFEEIGDAIQSAQAIIEYCNDRCIYVDPFNLAEHIHEGTEWDYIEELENE